MRRWWLVALLGGCAPQGFGIEETTFVSEQTGREYALTAMVPDRAPDEGEDWGVMVLVDGSHTRRLVDNAHARIVNGHLVPATILLAVDPVDPETWEDDLLPADEGGVEAFSRFLADELVPWTLETWPEATLERTRRGVFGRGVAGLTVLHMMLHGDRAFYGYGAASPALTEAGGAAFDWVDAVEDDALVSGRLVLSAGTLESARDVTAPLVALAGELEDTGWDDYQLAWQLLYGRTATGVPAVAWEELLGRLFGDDGRIDLVDPTEEE